jgi:hypothetical protein
MDARRTLGFLGSPPRAFAIRAHQGSALTRRVRRPVSQEIESEGIRPFDKVRQRNA